MQRAASRLASASLRRLAASATRPPLPAAVAPLWTPAASVHATTRLILQPTTAAAPAAALCVRRGYARGVDCDDDNMSSMESEEEMLSDFDQDDDVDDEDLEDLDDDEDDE